MYLDGRIPLLHLIYKYQNRKVLLLDYTQIDESPIKILPENSHQFNICAYRNATSNLLLIDYDKGRNKSDLWNDLVLSSS